ncbi:MAG: RNA polymerase sigma factor [Gemmatimonadales bacterium]
MEVSSAALAARALPSRRAAEPPSTGIVVGSAMSDLVRRAQAGDAQAFEALYRANVGRVHALCLRLAGEAQAAGELTQDVFVRVWETLSSFRGESAFSSWLHRVAMNVFLAQRRASGRRERRVLTTDAPGLLERSGDAAPAGNAVDLERAIAQLPEGARVVFMLHDVQGYQHGEIARLMGIAEGTSKAQLFRARRLLREALS